MDVEFCDHFTEIFWEHQMKYMQLAFLIILVISSNIARADDQTLNQWDDTTPAYPFFSNGIIKECPSCDTLVIIASTTKVSPQLVQQFKKLSQRIGNDRTNQGVIMRRDQVLSQADELTELRCRLPEHNELNVAYFVDRKGQRCIKIPYQDEDTLRITLERIYGYLGNTSEVAAQLDSVNRDRVLREYYENAKQAIGSTAPYIHELLQLALAFLQRGK